VFFTQRKKLMMTTYDEEAAKASGLPTARIQMMFMLLVGMAIAVSFPIVGILLLSSLLVLPVIAASQIARSFTETLIIAELLSVFSVVTGIITSYYTDISASGILTLILVGFFFVFFMLGSLKRT
jgi:zinc transport system permease protein